MARAGNRAKQRQRIQVILGVLALAAVAVIIGSVTVFMMSREAPPDPETLCPVDGPLGHYVLLVDKTDPLNFTQKQAFTIVLHELVQKRIPKGYLFSVFVVGEDYTAGAEPLIELCNPGSGEDQSEYTANLKRLREQYEDRFLKPLLERTEALQATQPAKLSPIVEMLQLVGINAFRRHDVTGERRLIIMSDMLHNTPQYSMYRQTSGFPSFADSDYGRKSHAELSSVEVELHYLINSPRLQTKRNLKFWEDYFAASGARIVAVRPLEG